MNNEPKVVRFKRWEGPQKFSNHDPWPKVPFDEDLFRANAYDKMVGWLCVAVAVFVLYISFRGLV